MSLLIAAAMLASSASYERCMARVDHHALGNNQMLECATADMDRADAALNARYRAVMQRLPAARRVTLRNEERRWITQRRARCLAAMSDPLPTPEINRMRCLVDATDDRTAYLSRIR